MDINGALDLDANIVGAASLAVSGSSNLGADVTTTGTQTYSGAVTLSAATITLTTTNSDVTFGGTIDSDAGQTRHLTIDTNGTTGTIQFGGLVGNTVALGAIGITGNLDLDANIVGAASLAVSGSSNLGASVTTTGNQTYTGAVTLSADVTLTTTNNGDVSFSNVVDGDYDLQVSTHGTGDTTFAQAVGANTALNNITITTDEFTAAAIKADGTFSLTNLTASTISGILSETSALALTKAGVGNLTLTAVHTFTGDTTISAGDVIVGGSGQLGSGSYGGAISLASGSTLSFGSSVSQTLSGVISGDGDVEKVTSAASTLTLSGDNTYTGGTNVSAGYLQSGSSSGASPPTSGPFGTATVTVASGAVLDVNGQTVGNAINLSGTGISENGALINSHATAATISGDITLAAHTSVGGAHAVTLSGAISGTGINFTKVGASTYTLSGNNTYTGLTTISNGVIAITHNNALGTTAGTTTVASGAALHLSNNITVAEAITIGGTGISTNGAIRNVADSNTLSGLITLAADAEIQIDTGTTLALNVASGNAITGTFNLTMDSVGTSSIADPIATSTGNLTKTGAGTLTLSGTNTYTGDTTISAGTLKLTGNLNSATDLVIAPSATLDLQAALTAATLDLDGTISNTAGTSSLIISGTANLGGSITTTGTQTYTGAVTLSGGDRILQGSTVNFGGTITGTGSHDLTVTGNLDLDDAMTSVVDLSVSGTSNLGADITTTGTQTYTGVVTLSGGDRILQGSTVNFGGTITGTGSHDLTVTGNLDLDDAMTSVVDLSVSGSSNLGADITTTGTQTYTGVVTLSGGDRILQGSTVNFGGTITGTGSHDLTVTGNLDLDDAMTSVVDLSVSGTSNLGADITTTGTQTYKNAVTLTGDTTLATSNSNISFNSTVNSDAIGTKRDLTLTLGSGSASFTGIVGATSLADITLNSSATFNAAVTADNLTIAVNKTVTVKDDATITSTIALSGSSTLAVNNASAITIAGNITDTGSGNIISVNDSDASAAPNQVTFSGTVAADSLTVGTTTTAGKALFTNSAAAVITNITITGGDHADEDSTATFNYALTATAVTLDDNTGIATIVFAEDNSVTIAGTIDGADNNEGVLKITGTLKTFSNNIGSNKYLSLLDVDSDVSFSGNVLVSEISVSANIIDSGNVSVYGTSVIINNVYSQGAQVYDGDVVIAENILFDSNNNQIIFNGTVNSEPSEANNITFNVGLSDVVFNGQVGGVVDGSLGIITITGNLDLDANIVSAASLDVSGSSNLGANVTTTGTQTYTGAVTISTDAITLTTTNNQITFSSTVNSAASAAHAINFNVGNAEVEFDGIVGGADNGDLGAIGITGNLDLDANIVGAASLAVSGSSLTSVAACDYLRYTKPIAERSL